MREVPEYFWKWTEIDPSTGYRLVKKNVPEDVLIQLIKDEKDEYNKTGRRCITNISIE